MPENTIREQTFCCGSGAGLGTDENLEMRLRGGLPRANAAKYVHQKHGVNMLLCMCAIDIVTSPPGSWHCKATRASCGAVVKMVTLQPLDILYSR